MVLFLRRLSPFLDGATRKRLAAAALLATVAAVLEAVGLALVLPLMQSITAASTNGPPPAASKYLSPWFDHPTSTEVAAILGAAVFVLFIVKGILAVGVLRWNLGTILRAEALMAERLLSAYLNAPWTFHLAHNSAELQRTVQDSVRRVFQDGLVGILGAFSDIVILLAILVVLLVLEPVVAVFAVLFFLGVALGYQSLIHGRIQAAAVATHEDTMEAFLFVQQSLVAAKEIGLLDRSQYFSSRLGAAKLRLSKGQRTLLLLNQLPRYYLEVALICGVGLLSVLLYSTTSPVNATGALVLFLAAGFRLLPSLNRVIVAVNMARAGKPALSQILEDFDATATSRTNGATRPIHFETLSLRQVVFRYPGATTSALNGVSMAIRRGQSVGLVGASGAGKSTLADVILGLLHPDSGEMTLDGAPFEELRRSWQRSVGYVPQQVGLLDDTLRANIAFGIAPGDIDEPSITRAITMSELNELVHSLPHGLDSLIGEAGMRLSGGQRQRIGIARALYTAPAVLVLDEATSALDSATEARIAHTLNLLKGELTLVIIAHRLSTIRACDQIYLLQHGRIIGSGDFTSLERSNEQFANLVRLGNVVQSDPDTL